MEVLIQKTFMNLMIWVLQLLDAVFAVFKQLAGLTPMQTENGGETDITSAFLKNEIVTQVFFGIVIIAAVICGIAIIVAIVKGMINLNGGEQKSIVRITGQGIGVIFATLLMAGIMITGISFASLFLKDIHKAFVGDSDTKLSNFVFDISVDKVITYTPDYNDPETNDKTETFDDPVWLINDAGDFVYDEEGKRIRQIFGYKVNETQSGWEDGVMPKDFDINNLTADEVYGERPSSPVTGWENADKVTKNGKEGLIKLGSFNFVVGYFSGIILLVAICSASLGLVKRLYDIVILFLSLPLITATIPLDDGIRFKVWRETVVSKIVIAYGAVFAVNVFLIMVPIIQGFAIEPIMKMLLLVGGGLSISGGTLLFARLFGTDAAESRDMAQSARTLIAGGAAGIAGAKWAAGKIADATGKVGTTVTSGGIKGLLSSLTPKNKATSSGISNSNSGITPALSSLGGGAYKASLNSQALPGSSLGQAMSTAGVTRGIWNKDVASGKFVTAEKAAAIDKGLTNSKANSGVAVKSAPNKTSGNSAAGKNNNIPTLAVSAKVGSSGGAYTQQPTVNIIPGETNGSTPTPANAKSQTALQNRMKFKNPTTENKRK
jgi:hypothetical protein